MDRPVGATPKQVEVVQPAYAGVHPCGRVAELGFRDSAGKLIVLTLPHQALSMLLMTLPRLIERSLRQRTGDASLRHVYPAGKWTVEAAAGEPALLLTLATPDGFSVSFRLGSKDAQGLGAALGNGALAAAEAMPPARH
jgi:hypothetical protein